MYLLALRMKYYFLARQRAFGFAGLGMGLLVAGCTQMPTETSGSAVGERRLLAATAPDTTGYETAAPRDPNGIGTYYLGRQIAHVMGHDGAGWLERSGRRQEEGTDILLREPDMIAALQQNKQKLKVRNVRPVLGTTTNPALPADSVDVVLIVDAYHEFDHPREMGRAIRRALRPGTGRLALVEYRAEDPSVPIKRIHKMSIGQARKEMAAVGLILTDSIATLPQQHLLLFRK